MKCAQSLLLRKLRLQYILAALLLAATPGVSQAQKTIGNPQCGGNSTVDLLGPKAAKEARAFLGELQTAVQSNDENQVAGMIRYPLLVIRAGKRSVIRDKQLFLVSYDRIFTPPVRTAVSKQTAECLFGNAMGSMVGAGEVWFREQPDGTMKIVTVNEDSGRHGSAP